MATRWTPEQLQAIEEDGTNIIVSAGAGSGKTAVLTERVLSKIKNGIHINELLIMTFTNAAAKEMKDRIRKKLKKEGLTEEVNLIDSAYITTFDSFSLSIVKKYHYILNIGKNIMISDNVVLNMEKTRIMDDVFNSFYENDTIGFKNFVSNFSYKDDTDLKRMLLKLSDKLDMKYDKNTYLDNYIDEHYTDLRIDKDIAMFFNRIRDYIKDIEIILNETGHYVDGSYIEKCYEKLNKLLHSESYDDVVTSLDFTFPRLPKDSSEEAKALKSKISAIIKEIKKMCIYENNNEIKKELLSTKSDVSVIIEILKEFDRRFTNSKLEKGMFSFSDISRMAIEIVSKNIDIRNELKDSFKEIMVDEYQDTNDIQEYFISLISDHNVYMVGDVKQSIYRFRNANPYIFKNKYDKYSMEDDGIKIDLVKNFRSRDEVLSNINLIFDFLMNDDYGGANYKESHRMVFGNKTYSEEGMTEQNYNLDIYTYEEEQGFSKAEQEIFAIGHDILDKINNHYLIFDKDELIIREAKFSDFVILLDRSSDFDLYKSIFEYLSIPLNVYKDEEIKNDYDILIIRNLLKLVKAIDTEEYNEEFKYAFLSVGRSFLFRLSDEELFDFFLNNSFKESIIYQKVSEAYDYYYELSFKMFFIKLLEIFDYEEKILTVGNVEMLRVREEYFYHLLENLEAEGKTMEDFIEYLDTVFESDDKVTFSANNSSSDSVQIMTIHKSKGLEFPICYFAGFYKNFSFRELNESILYHNDYGIITPYFNEYSKDTIYKYLMSKQVRSEEISEKIRLFYVAVTRAKEKMIILMPKVEEEINKDLIVDYDRKNIKSFYDMMKLVYEDVEPFVKNIKISCTKDYLINKSTLDYHDLIDTDTLVIDDVEIDKTLVKEERFSKNGLSIVSVEDKEKMEFGTKIHEILEFIDFKNPNYDNMDPFIKNKITNFINSDIIKNNLDSKFYKEYEFCYLENDVFKHGIIDLMIENDNEVIIIDYKLKNTDDEAYLKQLAGYKKYISSCTLKKVSTYLYSIIDSKFTLLK